MPIIMVLIPFLGLNHLFVGEYKVVEEDWLLVKYADYTTGKKPNILPGTLSMFVKYYKMSFM